jgi:Peptidase M15
MDVGTFATIVFCVCKIFGGSITSWVRSDARNKSVGGVVNSKHKDGLAVDIVLDDPKNNDPCINALRACKLRAFWDKDHIHAESL